MQAPRLLFSVASREGTGTLTLLVGSPPTEKIQIELERGYVYSIHGGPKSPRPDENLRNILKKAPMQAAFDAAARALRLGRCPPFHPAVIVRNHVEAAIGVAAGGEFRQRAAEKPLRLVYPPHPSCLGSDERPLVALLGAPRTVADLDGARLTPPFRIDRLLAFLDAVGSVSLEPTPYEVLGVREGAPHDEVRRAYKRLARELHPDAHPGAADDELRALSGRFNEVTAAFRRLMPAE